MNVKKEQIDDLNAVIEIELEPADYNEKVQVVLGDYRKKAKFDGFRPGKVPVGLVKKMYGKAILVDEVQKLLSETLNDFIKESNLKILGEPIPSEDSPKVDWDLQDAGFLFKFDIGLAPEFDIALSKKDKIPHYNIIVSDEMINDQIQSYTRRFGSFESAEVVGEKDLLKVDLVQLDANGEPLAGGVNSENSTLSMATLQDDNIRQQLTAAKVNDEITILPELLFPNETDRAAALKITKEDLSLVNGNNFKLTIKEVSVFKDAEINQDLFDKAFGEGEITSEEDFRNRVKEMIAKQLETDSNYKLHLDAKEKVMGKVGINLPETFLKRWMLLSQENKELTSEKLEEEFPAFANDLKWQLIKNKIVAEHELAATEEEISQEAVRMAYTQYRQYGIYQVADEQLFRLADHMLKNEEEQRRLVERILENKVIEQVQSQIKLDDKEITFENFQKLLE